MAICNRNMEVQFKGTGLRLPLLKHWVNASAMPRMQ